MHIRPKPILRLNTTKSPTQSIIKEQGTARIFQDLAPSRLGMWRGFTSPGHKSEVLKTCDPVIHHKSSSSWPCVIQRGQSSQTELMGCWKARRCCFKTCDVTCNVKNASLLKVLSNAERWAQTNKIQEIEAPCWFDMNQREAQVYPFPM